MHKIAPSKRALNCLCKDAKDPVWSATDYLVYIDEWNASHVEDW